MDFFFFLDEPCFTVAQLGIFNFSKIKVTSIDLHIVFEKNLEQHMSIVSGSLFGFDKNYLCESDWKILNIWWQCFLKNIKYEKKFMNWYQSA